MTPEPVPALRWYNAGPCLVAACPATLWAAVLSHPDEAGRVLVRHGDTGEGNLFVGHPCPASRCLIGGVHFRDAAGRGMADWCAVVHAALEKPDAVPPL